MVDLREQALDPGVRAGLLATALIVTGHFSAFTYVSPIIQHAGVAAAGVGLVLVGYGGVSVSLQSWTIDAASAAVEAATSLWVAVFNLSISLGALAGGPLLDATGVSTVLVAGAAVVVLATVPAGRAVLVGRRNSALVRSG